MPALSVYMGDKPPEQGNSALGQYIVAAPPPMSAPTPGMQQRGPAARVGHGWSSRFEDGPPRPFFPLPSEAV